MLYKFTYQDQEVIIRTDEIESLKFGKWYHAVTDQHETRLVIKMKSGDDYTIWGDQASDHRDNLHQLMGKLYGDSPETAAADPHRPILDLLTLEQKALQEQVARMSTLMAERSSRGYSVEFLAHSIAKKERMVEAYDHLIAKYE